RSPFERQQEIRLQVAVHVTPKRTAHQADLTQPGRPLIRHVDETATVIAKQPALRNLRVRAGYDAATDEQVEVAVTVKISRDNRTAAVASRRQRALRGLNKGAVTISQIQPVRERRITGGFGHAALDYVEVRLAVSVGLENERSHRSLAGRVGPNEAALLVHPEARARQDDID